MAAREAKYAYLSVETLGPLVRESTSVAQVLSKLFLPTSASIHRTFVGKDGRAEKAGALIRPSKPGCAKRELRDEDVFVENGPYLAGPSITRRLLRLGWAYRCAWCGLSEWRGVRLVRNRPIRDVG